MNFKELIIKFKELIIKSENDIELSILSVGLSFIAYFFELLKPLPLPHKNYFKACQLFLDNHLQDSLILLIGLVLILTAMAFFLRQKQADQILPSSYIVWTFTVIISIIVFISSDTVYLWLFIITVSWMIYTLLKILNWIYDWMKENNGDLSLAKLTFVWSIIVAVVGFVLRLRK